MKIIENTEGAEDFAGRFPVCTVKGAELAKIADWLFSKHSDYKFGMVISTMGEYPVPENPAEYTVDVLFLDDLFTEIVAYMGCDKAQQWLDEMREKGSWR